ncbi:bifunctional methyltransferase/pyrophosphohydrolase YabN [Neobacillus dielmonensis]|uniref:nucleoside triphosphate pyrophosphohydrolase n=1 Tax=Neobacillus dielmonensis TaxID=1347369 RepID=UPI0005A77BC3|nr:nucleoside triphosphate pyrophosphohydrolase [Neobacillus dielmonensis]
MVKTIEIVGLGAGELEQLPLGVYRKLINTELVYLRTKEHPVVSALQQEGMNYRSFDEVYKKNEQFEAVYQEIVKTLLDQANSENVIYAVPGHPLVAERTVQILLEEAPKQGIEIKVGGGQSFIDALFASVKVDPIEGFQLLDGTSISSNQLQMDQHIIISQVYDQFVASDVKLVLMEKYPDDYEVVIVTAAGSENEIIQKVPLYELDRNMSVNNLTSVYVPPVKVESTLWKNFAKFREIIAILRGPNGCPWDKKQTHESLKKYLIEESYEVIDAIDSGDIDHLVEELGDVLLQVMLHAQIGEDEGFFTIDDVIEGISAKMVRRHPHVFGEGKADSAEEVVQNWQEIKRQEKGDAPPESILDGVSLALPNLLQAYELQKKAAKVGFDWQEIGPALEKVKEELKEFIAELDGTDAGLTKARLEYGDLLFAFVNVARFLDMNPEESLFAANQKFIRRFRYIEEKVNKSGRPFKDFTLEELDRLWDEAKLTGL